MAVSVEITAAYVCTYFTFSYSVIFGYFDGICFLGCICLPRILFSTRSLLDYEVMYFNSVCGLAITIVMLVNLLNRGTCSGFVN